MRASDLAAETAGVSPRSLHQAQQTRRDGVPELIPLAATGVLSAHAAQKVSLLDHHEQRELISRIAAGELHPRKVATEADRLRRESQPTGPETAEHAAAKPPAGNPRATVATTRPTTTRRPRR